MKAVDSGDGEPRARRLGQYYSSGDWSDYWSTAVSYVGPHKVLVRGYPIEEVVANLSYAETVFMTLRGELPTPGQARTLDAVLNSLPPHQWVAAHLLSAAVTASGFPESPIPGIASGILTMGSNTVSPQASAELLARARAIGDEGVAEELVVERVLAEYLDAGRHVPGLGHPNHKDEDPRAAAVAAVAKEQGCWGASAEFYAALPAAMRAATGKRLPVNIDGMLGSVLDDLGFSPPEMAGIAAIAAMPGLVAQVVEEIESGVPLRVVPEALGSRYVGPPERHLDDRR
jgi:citrate synthase